MLACAKEDCRSEMANTRAHAAYLQYCSHYCHNQIQHPLAVGLSPCRIDDDDGFGHEHEARE